MDAKPKTKWEAKREASYAALVRSAMQRFHERGYAATTVNDIVEGTGYTAGAFYFHFDNKADCFWHVIDHRERLLGDWWEVALNDVDPSSASLEQVLARAFAHFAEALEGFTGGVLVMADFHAQHRAEPEAMARLAEVYGRWRLQLERFVAALAEGGWIDRDRDPVLLATQMFAFGEGMTVHTRIYSLDEEIVQAALIDGLVRILR
jgi:AcrR family transcriptional regulator